MHHTSLHVSLIAQIFVVLLIQVFEATSITNQQVYAVKMLDKRHLQKEKKVQYANSERACLTKLGAGSHPGIIRLYSAFQDASSLCKYLTWKVDEQKAYIIVDFVLQFARNGDLLECLLRLGSFNLECTRYYAGTILDAVCFMHSMNIVHRYDPLTLWLFRHLDIDG